MANPKVGNKAKLKEDKNKLSNSNTDLPDASVLRKPIPTSITGLAQARKIFDTATEELKGLLTTECDLLYECKVCRNLFRSLANFISHKRVYCKEIFNSSIHGHFMKSVTTMSEILKIKHVEEGYQDYLKNKSTQDPEVPTDRVPISKDLTSVVENLMKNAEATTPDADDKPLEVAVQAIPNSSAAVFQNLVRSGEDDDMCTEVAELDSFMAKDSALLEADGKFEICAKPKEKQLEKEDEQVIQISDDDDNGQLSCKICDIQFSTRKTLKFHMKYKHVPDRLVYPCTDCCDIFATSWSVLRHLYRVHRKTLTQIRRMRELVQSRAFRMNNVPTSYVKKKNIKKAIAEEKLTEEERMDQENQAWMDNMESDSELPRCGGCGRSFERRAALAAHTYTCQSRTRALARKPTPYERPAVKKEVKSSVLAPKPLVSANSDEGEKATTKVAKPPINECEEKEKTPPKEIILEEPKEENIEVDDIPSEEESKNNEELDLEGTVLNVQEKANMDALKKKIVGFVEKDGTCKVCQRKYTTPSHLCRHMASHFTWRRFGCKLCNYSNYDKNRLVTHAQGVHKLKGSDEFYTSIIRVLTPTEALAQSATPTVVDEEWVGGDDEESSEFGEVSASSGDESESSSSRMESSKPNRRKQSFKPVKVAKSKSSESANDEEKLGIKRQSQTPIDKESLCDEKNKHSTEQDKKEDEKIDAGRTNSRRPVRKRTRPKKDEDFEYDFSNLMRWESSSYKEADARASSSRSINSKRKSTAESSPSESSPEKIEKQEKNEKTEAKDDIPKQVNMEEKKKSYAGALATMSDRAVAQYRAHLRPVTLFTSDRLLLLHKVPFDVREHMKKIQSSKVIVAPQNVNKRKNFMISSSAFDKNEHNKEVKKESVDIEKEIEDANAANKKNVFQATNVRTLVQIPRSNSEMVQNNTLPNKKQKVIVMKRVNSGADTKQSAGGTIQFQRIKYGSGQPINVKQATTTPENPQSTEDRMSNPVVATNIDNKDEKIIDNSCTNGSAEMPKNSDQPETIAIV